MFQYTPKILLLTSMILFSACATKEITKDDILISHFALSPSYQQDVIDKMVNNLRYDLGKRLGQVEITYNYPVVGTPQEKCSRDLFQDTVTCIYTGNASISYDVPSLRRWGQKSKQKSYDYIIEKRNISVYRK